MLNKPKSSESENEELDILTKVKSTQPENICLRESSEKAGNVDNMETNQIRVVDNNYVNHHKNTVLSHQNVSLLLAC